ncbi:MAG: FHA domain-containing protein [Planctomycetota bacterium]
MMQIAAVDLVSLHPNGARRSVRILPDTGVFIGRSPNCGLQLEGPDVSEIHCRIGFENGQLWVQNWPSAKTTLLNGTIVESNTQVARGAIIEVGPYSIQFADVDEKELSKVAHSDSEGRVASTTTDESEKVATESNSESEDLESENSVWLEESWDASWDAQDELTEQTQSPAPDSTPIISNEDAIAASFGVAGKPSPIHGGLDIDLSDEDEEEFYDRETVELLQAEIEDLRAALARRDAEESATPGEAVSAEEVVEDSDRILERMQELIDEANRADERVMILEEMLHAAEDAGRAELEERGHLEAWVGDIEKRIGQKEQEHASELSALRRRLEDSQDDVVRLHQKLQDLAAGQDKAPDRYAETLESLQASNCELGDELSSAQTEVRELQQQIANQAELTETALREERAKIAKEHAEVSRLKFEFAQRIKELEELPASESDPRLQTLREHRQEIRSMNEERKKEETTLAGRLKNLWKRVEQDRI